MALEGDGMESVMKRKKKKLFIHIFLRTTILLLLLITAGCLTYYTVMLYWQPKDKNSRNAFQEDTKPVKVTPIGSDNISKNLIFSYDKENNEIDAVILEIMDCKNDKLFYLTLPVKTQLTMNPALYQKMALGNPEMPQMLKLSALTEYMDFKKSALDSVKILAGVLDTNINYYTVIPSDTFSNMFLGKDVKQPDNSGVVTKYAFKWAYQKKLNTLNSEDKVKEYIKDNYSDVKSNLPIKDKLSLSKYYNKIKTKDVSFELLEGKNMNNGYVIDDSVVQQQVADITKK